MIAAFPFVPGVHDAVPMDAYHAMPALSSSGVKKLLRSPAHYIVDRTKQAEPTDAMQFGTAVHLLTLEPARAGDVVELPEFNARTTNGREQRDAWKAANAGKLVFNAETMERLQATVSAIRAHPAASMLLAEGVAERTVLWRDGTHGIECRARFDWWRPDGVIVDIKTTRDASPESFARDIHTFGYAISAAHYWTGHEAAMNESPRAWVFIAAESEPPHGVAVYALDAASLRVGMRHCERAYRLFAECLQLGQWPAYPNTIEPISLPTWARKFQGE